MRVSLRDMSNVCVSRKMRESWKVCLEAMVQIVLILRLLNEITCYQMNVHCHAIDVTWQYEGK
jgi:hypothetical protein